MPKIGRTSMQIVRMENRMHLSLPAKSIRVNGVLGQMHVTRMVSIQYLKALAGVSKNNPVFRECCVCKKWQIYSDDAKGIWYEKEEKENLLKRFEKQFPELKRLTSHTICPEDRSNCQERMIKGEIKNGDRDRK